MDDIIMIDPSKIIPAMVRNDICTVVARTCGICDCPLTYERDADNNIWFDGSCDCTMTDAGLWQRNEHTLAEWINTQPTREHKLRVAALFGLTEEDFDRG